MQGLLIQWSISKPSRQRMAACASAACPLSLHALLKRLLCWTAPWTCSVGEPLTYFWRSHNTLRCVSYIYSSHTMPVSASHTSVALTQHPLLRLIHLEHLHNTLCCVSYVCSTYTTPFAASHISIAHAQHPVLHLIHL